MGYAISGYHLISIRATPTGRDSIVCLTHLIFSDFNSCDPKGRDQMFPVVIILLAYFNSRDRKGRDIIFNLICIRQ